MEVTTAATKTSTPNGEKKQEIESFEEREMTSPVRSKAQSIHAKLMGPETSANCHAKVACGEPGDVHTNLSWWLNELEKDTILALIRRAALVTVTEPHRNGEWAAMDDLKEIVGVVKGN